MNAKMPNYAAVRNPSILCRPVAEVCPVDLFAEISETPGNSAKLEIV